MGILLGDARGMAGSSSDLALEALKVLDKVGSFNNQLVGLLDGQHFWHD